MKMLTVKIRDDEVRLYDGKRFIGYAKYLTFKGRYLLLLEIGIKKEFQLKGYGKFLVNMIYAIAKRYECKSVELWSLKDSFSFWKHLGFKVLATEKDIYYMQKMI